MAHGVIENGRTRATLSPALVRDGTGVGALTGRPSECSAEERCHNNNNNNNNNNLQFQLDASFKSLRLNQLGTWKTV